MRETKKITPRMKLVDKEKIECSLNVARVGLTQARRNRTRYIRQLGDTYYQYAGKISLYNMMKLVEEEKKNENRKL